MMNCNPHLINKGYKVSKSNDTKTKTMEPPNFYLFCKKQFKLHFSSSRNCPFIARRYDR